MMNEYLNRIQAIIAELRSQLDSGDVPNDIATQIREYIEQLERITDQYKEP